MSAPMGQPDGQQQARADQGPQVNPHGTYPPPLQVPTFRVEVTRHTGGLVFFSQQRRSVLGTYQQCDAALRSAQNHNLLLGWWSFLSILMLNWIALLQNSTARKQLNRDVQQAHEYAQWWHRYIGPTHTSTGAQAPAQLSEEAANIVHQLIDQYRDGEWPTDIGWYLPAEQPPWEALEELRRSGHCLVTQEGHEVLVDFTDAGRRAHLHDLAGG